MMRESHTDFPWSDEIGSNVGEFVDAKQIVKAAKLDWTVVKEPLYFLNKDQKKTQFDGAYALVRHEDEMQIGICGKEYQPVQNDKAFEFFERFTRRGAMRIEMAGSFRGQKGLHVWALASLKHKFELPGNDIVKSYVLLSHPHIWGQSLQIKPTAMRISCYNSLVDAIKNSEKCFKHWHTTEFADDAVEAARDVVVATIKYVDSVKQKAELLVRRMAKTPEISQYLMELFQPETLEGAKEPGWSANPYMLKTTARSAWEGIFNSPGADLESCKGTWWGVLNGVTHLVDHKLGRDPGHALQRAWLGTSATKKLEALELAVEYAEKS